MIKEKLREDLKRALKSKDQLRALVLRLLLSEIHNQEIEKKEVLSDEEIQRLLQKSLKSHEESIAQFQAGKREELAEKEQKELEIIRAYLPPSLSEKDLVRLISKTFQEMQKEQQEINFGKLMKAVLAKVSGRAPGRMVSELVKKQLS